MKQKFNKDMLRKMFGTIKTYKIASYDIETDTSDNINNFLFGGFIDANGVYKCFKDKDKMIAYMIKHVDKDTLVYATNNSFDHYALFGHKEDFLKEAPLMRGSLLINAKYHGINTFDTRSYTKYSVESLGLMLGIHKFNLSRFMKNEDYMKKYFNINMFKDKYKFYKARDYNHRDCKITREFVIGFQKVLNELGGNLKCTIGSCAMDLFKRKYLEENIQHEHNKKFQDGTTLKELLSDAYHGGRTELFNKTSKEHKPDLTKEYYSYDFNSLYPSVMLNEFPKPVSCQLTEHKFGRLNISSIIKFDGISKIKGVCPYMNYPILPMVINKKLMFACGKIEGTFTHVELRKFLECGGKITKIYKTACYTKKFSPFKKWVNELYELRLQYDRQNNDIYKEIIKLLLNNLYGKFFQRNIVNMEFINLKDRNDEDLKQDGFTFDYNVGFGYRETPKESKQTFIIPIIAVYTTAFARLKLHEKLVELNGIYSDTDSIVSEKIITTSKMLGDVKLERKFDNINIFLPKTYKYYDKTHNKWVIRAKGIKLGEDAMANYEKVITGQPVKQLRFSTIKESIRSGGKFRPNEMREIEKTSRSIDAKRNWTGEFNEFGLEISKPHIFGMTENELKFYFR